MPPPLLIDLAPIDLDQVLVTREEIYKHLPQRYEFQVLDGVCMLDPVGKRIVAFAEIRPDDWWVRGHLPDRPLLPGVLMLEMAGQVSAVGARLLGEIESFIGFGGVEECRFRETVVPPTRLYLLCVGSEFRRRRIISHVQGVIDGRLVFEAKILGLALRE